MDILHHHRTDIQYADGAWAEASVIRFPAAALHFADIAPTQRLIRMKDAGRLRYHKARKRGEHQPAIVVWACLERDRPATRTFPNLTARTEAGEMLLSTNSFVTYALRTLLDHGWIQWRDGLWRTTDDTPQEWRLPADTILSWLTDERRIMLDVGPDVQPPNVLTFTRFQARHNLIPVGRCGFVRDVVREELPLAVFNSTYFLLEHDDFLSHHSALGDPYGLLVQDSIIHRPPLYHRGTIWQTANGDWAIEQIGMTSVALLLPDGSTLLPYSAAQPHGFHVNPASDVAIAVYTRYFGAATEGRVLGQTPPNNNRIEYTVIDRQITGWKKGGELLIPQNGYVLSFDSNHVNPALFHSVQQNPHIAYTFTARRHQGMRAALGCGPILAQHGRITLSNSTLAQEQYWISRDGIIGVVPTDYPNDVDETRAARIGMGITAAGELIVVAISGTSKELTINRNDSAGATLVELAKQLLANGARAAINLDGGGSVQLFIDGGLYNRPGDQRGDSGVIYERMLPTVGMVSLRNTASRNRRDKG